MRTALRTAVAGALAAPLLVVAASGAATAEQSSNCRETTRTSENGSYTKSVCSEVYIDHTLDSDERELFAEMIRKLL